MPKILENIRENLLSEAKRQVLELGYSAMTIRSVASACGVGVGTVYNYFPSKDMLVASFMLEEWQECLELIRTTCDKAQEPNIALRSIYEGLLRFIKKYSVMFQDENAGVSFAGAFRHRHEQLRSQLAEPVYKLCQTQTKVIAEFLAEFIAESMLTWTLAGRTFEDIGSVLLQLF